MTDSVHSGDYCPDCGEPIHAIYLMDDLKEHVIVDAESIDVWVRIEGVMTEIKGARNHSDTCKGRVHYNGPPTI